MQQFKSVTTLDFSLNKRKMEAFMIRAPYQNFKTTYEC